MMGGGGYDPGPLGELEQYSQYIGTGWHGGVISGRIAYAFGFEGPADLRRHRLLLVPRGPAPRASGAAQR
ncbi:hypothetical protein SBADM41S_04015 [Streptomyces badius]